MTRLLEPEEANGKAGEILREIHSTFGMVPNFFKAQAAEDPDWLELNWRRHRAIMQTRGELDRVTKELIAMAVSFVNGCEYCSLAHETMALMAGATPRAVLEAKQVIELFESFNAIAETLRIPCDIRPEMAT